MIPQIDPGEIGYAFHRASAEIAEKGHFWMETKSYLDKTLLKGHGRRVLCISLSDLLSTNQITVEEHD